jgi:hypothetical protein
VSVFVDDARSFFRKTTARYDLIVFGALDSHTLTSSLSNIRIDNYVYTVQAFAEARDLLSEDGLVCVVFSLERSFIGRRLEAMLGEAFGTSPLAFMNREIRLLGGAGGGPTFLADRQGRLREMVRADPRLAKAVAARLVFKEDVPLATDDWPYLYLQRRTIPRLYLVVTVILVLASLAGVRVFAGEWRRVDPAFFLMGSAFLLIEVQGISKMALLFGTTWQVNAVIVGAVLVMILLANAVADRVRARSLLPLFALLGVSLAVNLVFPFGSLLGLSPWLKGLVAGTVMAVPVFFAGLIFSLLFKGASDARVALGSNLMGAIAGGVSESLSFVIGINALGALALLFYAGAAAWLASRGRLRLA